MSDELVYLVELRKSWERSLRAAHRSPRTIKTYGQGVRQFIAFLQSPRAERLPGEEDTPAQLLERYPVRDETDIRRDHVAAFIGEVLRQWKPATASARWTALHVWFDWMIEQPDIDITLSPMVGMKPPTIPEQHPQVMKTEDIRKLLGTCDPKTFLGARDEAVIRLLIDTGIRVGELAGLMAVEVLDGVRVPCVDLDTESVYVVGKGRRPRTVAFGASTALALDRYLRARRKHPQRDAPHLWLTIRGKAGMSEDGVRKMLDARGDQAGIGHIHPHLFRHTWADAMKRRGLDRGDLKNQGGWRSDAMVDRYGASAATDRALNAHRRRSFGDEI